MSRDVQVTLIYLSCQLYTGQPPFPKSTRFQVVRKFVEGARPLKPSGFPDDMWRVIESCWQHTPSARPSSADIVRNIAEQIEASPIVNIVSGITLNDNANKSYSLQLVFPRIERESRRVGDL